MATYWDTRPRLSEASSVEPNPSTSASGSSLAGYAQHRQRLLARGEEGWVAELGRYLSDLSRDSSPEMDVIKYWQVCIFSQFNPQPLRVTYHISKIITPSIRRSDESPLTFFPVKPPLSPANTFSLPANRSRQIGVCDSVGNNLMGNNLRSSNS
jgi:hypothetical protein